MARDKNCLVLGSPDVSKGPHPLAVGRTEPTPRPAVGIPPPAGHPGGPSPQVDFSQRIANAMNMANLWQQGQVAATSPPQPRMSPVPAAAQQPMGAPPIPVPSVASMQPASSFAAQAKSSPAAAAPAGDNEGFILPNLPSLVIIDPNVELFRLQPKLKPIVPLAMDRAIRDIVTAGRDATRLLDSNALIPLFSRRA